MKFISMFSGIEAASVAFGPLGWKAICLSEVADFPSKVLAHRFPGVPNLGDMTKVDWSKYRGQADLVCGGPPCQAFSVAGLRESLEDARGNLSLEFFRAIGSIRPKWVLVENVPGWLSTKDNAFGCFLAGLVGADAPFESGLKGGKWPSAGVASGPQYGLAWRVLDAKHFGVPQRRRRVFVVGYLGDWRPAAKVLFEPEGLPRDLEKGRQAQAGPASPAADGTGGGGLSGEVSSLTATGVGTCGADDNQAQAGHLLPWTIRPDMSAVQDSQSPTIDSRVKDGPRRNQGGTIIVGHGTPEDRETAYPLKASYNKQDESHETFVTETPKDPNDRVVGTLDASYGSKQGASGQDLNHGHSHLVVNMQGSKGNAVVHSDGTSPTLNAMHGHDVHAVLSDNKPQGVLGDQTHALSAEGADASEDGTGRGTPIIAFSSKDSGADAGPESPTLRAGNSDKSHQNGGVPPAVVVPILEAGARTGKSTDDPRAGMGVGEPGDPMYTLQAGKQHAVAMYENHAQDSRVKEVDVCPQLNAKAGTGGNNLPLVLGAGSPIAVNASQDPVTSDTALPVDTNQNGQAVCFQQNSRSEVRLMGDKTGAVTSEPGAQCQNYIFDPYNNKADEVSSSLGTNCGGSTGRSIAFTQNQNGDVLTGDVAPAMGTNQNASGRNTPKVATGMLVRRLTPTECERLQGFPDGWTLIPVRKVKNRSKNWEEKGYLYEQRGDELWLMAPDGPRYKAIGNSWAVPVARWIGLRMQRVEEEGR